jgi:hypothetical protein
MRGGCEIPSSCTALLYTGISNPKPHWIHWLAGSPRALALRNANQESKLGRVTFELVTGQCSGGRAHLMRGILRVGRDGCRLPERSQNVDILAAIPCGPRKPTEPPQRPMAATACRDRPPRSVARRGQESRCRNGSSRHTTIVPTGRGRWPRERPVHGQGRGAISGTKQKRERPPSREGAPGRIGAPGSAGRADCSCHPHPCCVTSVVPLA